MSTPNNLPSPEHLRAAFRVSVLSVTWTIAASATAIVSGIVAHALVLVVFGLTGVLDAAGSRRAYLFGVSEGGPMSILFAATYPERVAGLILFGTYARTVGASIPFDDFAGLERDIQ